MNFEEFIINNYSTIGLKKCTEVLSTTKAKVQTIVNRHNLKIDKVSKSIILSNRYNKTQEEHKVNISKFKTDIDSNSAYILGLLWADGYIHKIKSNPNKKYDISLECVDDDMLFFRLILNKTGDWFYYTRKRGNYKPITKATTNNKEFLIFLTDNDYDLKSIKSPDKIIDKLPNDLIKFFLLGVIDGDGCFYFNQKHFLRQFSISGSLNQDWSAFEKIFISLGITYKINRRSNDKNGSSQIRILNKLNIKKLGDFVYSSISEDNIGLPRKYEKYLSII
jgi:hypothetical protein